MSTVNSSRMCKVTNKKRIIRLLYIPFPIYDVIFNIQTTSHFLLDRMLLYQVYSLVLSYLLIAGAVTSHRVITVTMKIPLYRVIKKSLCTWRLQYSTQLMSSRRPSQNTFGMWTVLYWTRSSRTQFGVSINVWRLAGETLNITSNFLYCNHVHRDSLITL
jgi:hypothetical protein